MKKRGGKPIYRAEIVWGSKLSAGVKNLQNLTRKMVEENRMLIDWLRIGTRSLEVLDQKFEHDILIWGHDGHRSDISDVSDALISASLIGSFT